MNCMKCGREIPDTQVFCDGCLDVMEKYPVKPGTVVQISHRSDAEPVRKPSRKKRELSGDELIEHLQLTVKRLWICVLILSVLVCLAGAFLFHRWQQPATPVTGRNYTVDTTHMP